VWFAVGRTEPNLDDLGLAFDELHIILSELRKYVENVESTTFAHDVVEFPAPKSSRLQPVEQDQAAETAADRKNGLAPSGSQMDLEGSLIQFNWCVVVSVGYWHQRADEMLGNPFFKIKIFFFLHFFTFPKVTRSL